MAESQPAVANILPSERYERPCWPECFVAVILMGLKSVLNMLFSDGKGFFAMFASADDVR